MTAPHIVRESLVLERLRETYEQQGYAFFLEPSGDILPPFLRGYRPDAMALKGNGGEIIAVKFGPNSEKDDRLKALAKALKDQPDWRLRLQVEQPRAEDRLMIEPPTRPQLEGLIAESERLVIENHPRAAMLLAWSALEAVARTRAVARGLVTGRPLSPAGIVESLEMGGSIDHETGFDLRQTAQLRNRIAHGDLTAVVDPGSVESLIRCIKGLAIPVDFNPLPGVVAA